jgi:hypothetical protein
MMTNVGDAAGMVALRIYYSAVQQQKHRHGRDVG